LVELPLRIAPNIASNACPRLWVPGSRRCAHEGGAPKEFRVLSWNPVGGLIIWLCASFSLNTLPSGHQGARFMAGKITIEQKWHQQSEDAKNEAEKLPQGKEREAS